MASRTIGIHPSGLKQLSQGSQAGARDARGIRFGLADTVKIQYLYSMASRLVNVRLDEDRVRKAQTLRESGVALSDLVREAIDERFDELVGSGTARGLKAVMKRIFEQYPDPPDLPPRGYDVHDRDKARRAIIGKLRRVRR